MEKGQIAKVESHYHCPECGRVMKELGRLLWDVDTGIVVLWTCNRHLYSEEEYEHKLRKVKL